MWELLGVFIIFIATFLMLVCLLTGWWIIWGRAAADARALRDKFVSLGTLAGKRLADIERVVGKPKSWVTIGQNRFRYCWGTQKYHVTLVFQGDICEGISNEIQPHHDLPRIPATR